MSESDPAERQADALEALVQQTRVQNAVTLELVHELTALRRHQQGELPHEFSPEGKAGSIEDRALELAERVDLDAVDTFAESELMTDGAGRDISGEWPDADKAVAFGGPVGGREIVGSNDEPESPEHKCANCGATYQGRGAALECCSEDLRTDGGLKDIVCDEFPVVSGQISDPDGATAYQALATRVRPEEHPRLERAGFHSPQTLFTLFSPGGTPLADYDPYRIAREISGRDTDWVVDQLQALDDALESEMADEPEVRTDGGHDPEDGPNPESLPAQYTPAIVRLSGSGVGDTFVADYEILSSDWIRVTEWTGERTKYPPRRVTEIREVPTRYAGEPNDAGVRPKRLTKDEHRRQAQQNQARGTAIADD